MATTDMPIVGTTDPTPSPDHPVKRGIAWRRWLVWIWAGLMTVLAVVLIIRDSRLERDLARERGTARDRSRAEIFQQRIRCRSLADAFTRRETNESTTAFLDRVDFSVSRNSCIVSISAANSRTVYGTPMPTRWDYTVTDLLSLEVLWSDFCTENRDCEGGKNIGLMQQRAAVFERAVAVPKAVTGHPEEPR